MKLAIDTMEKLPTHEEIMKENTEYIPPGYLKRELIRVKKAMREYCHDTETFKFLYIAQVGLSYALDPFMFGSPLMTALTYGKQSDEFRSRHKAQDSEDYSLQNDQE